jgi:hypothetical protein
MTHYIWHWFSGNSKFYTRKKDVAEKAMKEGFSVFVKKIKTNIIKY